MTGRWLRWCEDGAITVLVLTLTALGWLLIATLAGLSPLATLITFVTGAFGSAFALEQTLRAATPLLLTGLAVAIPLRANLLALGGEGALVLGGVAAAVAAVSVPPALAMLAMFGAGMLVGAVWLGLSGWLRVTRGVHEAVAGLLLSYVAIAIANSLIEGPLRDPASFEKPASALIPAAAKVGTLGASNLHWGLLVGLLACVVAHVFIAHTPTGFAVRIGGGNPRAAAFANLSRRWHIVGVCLVGGALVGLAGALEVAAVHGRANASLAAGYGYIGILVAMLARGNLLAIVPAAILVGALDAGGGMLQRRLDAPAASAAMLHGLLFITLVTCTTLHGRLASWWLTRMRHA